MGVLFRMPPSPRPNHCTNVQASNCYYNEFLDAIPSLSISQDSSSMWWNNKLHLHMVRASSMF